jgi:hypothetical protein
MSCNQQSQESCEVVLGTSHHKARSITLKVWIQMFYVGWGPSRIFTQATKATMVLEWRLSFTVDSEY